MWIPIQINEQSAEPLYYQIEVQLRALIVSGQLAENTLLPSIRELAQQLKCSVITIRRVYQDLENEGILRTRQGTGTFVAKVGEEQRGQQRLSAVLEAMETAVEAGKLVQCSDEEMLDILREILIRKRRAGPLAIKGDGS
ncbi:GntR family transcriptional regulator [Paenibacillus nasutitermitis]|uniref:GntR family transcriptional regulator n=1 Tax=Paenibacillus nasutitermitis TaxID=1652958 RepID=A0A916Z7Y9_9BACL|nr:GntR family transcriptional regulator [Paenibacillus nasutitermitis]GGD80357.1 GntR family transcriptional regulator [Paenibacillus nasutitermitis]